MAARIMISTISYILLSKWHTCICTSCAETFLCLFLFLFVCLFCFVFLTVKINRITISKRQKLQVFWVQYVIPKVCQSEGSSVWRLRKWKTSFQFAMSSVQKRKALFLIGNSTNSTLFRMPSHYSIHDFLHKV